MFSDIWSPFAEAIILVVVALLGGSLWGMEGTLLGSIISSIAIIYIWKPYFLFSKGLKLSVWIYWREICRYSLGVCFSFYISGLVLDYIPIKLDFYTNWLDWFLYAIVILFLFAVIISAVLLKLTKGTRNLFYRFINR